MRMQINEVSERYGLSKDTLRYYERIGLIPSVPRNASGIRNYDQESLNWIEFIKCMRSAGLTIDALIAYATLVQQGDATLNARKQLLIEQRDSLMARMAELNESLERLNRKIQRREELMSMIPIIYFMRKKRRML